MSNQAALSLDAELQLKASKSRLTGRQLQVLARLSMGESNYEIGRVLGIAVKTVKVHVGQIYKLLGVNNRTRATIAAGRMAEVREQQSEEVARGPIRFSWLFPYAELRKYRAGQVVFRKGDPAKEMFYVRTGLVRLKETGKQLAQDDLFGEIGVFMPEHRRTASVECVVATQLYAISAESVMRLYMQNPQFALLIFQLTARRLDEDRAARSSH